MKMTSLYAITTALIVIISAIYITNLHNKLESTEEQLQLEQIQNEELKKANKRLTEDIEYMDKQYRSVRDELWNLKNGLERESAE